MAKTIILIDHEPFTIRRKELFYIEELIAAGFNVSVWNITRWYYPEMSIVDTIDKDYVKHIKGVIELQECLESCNIKDSVFIVESFWNWRTRELFRMLSDYKCCTIRMDLYANSTLMAPMSTRIKKLFSGLIIGILKNRFKQLLLLGYNKIHKVKQYDYYLSSSAIVNRTHSINHPDYEKWRFDKSKPVIDGCYAVFCDIYFPYHPDIKNFAKCSHEVNGEVYQRKLRDFFDFIELKYQLPVVIAAHPKADYDGNEFGNRPIIKYKTNNLIAYSSLVLMHWSNSVSFAVLNKRPIVLFYTDEHRTNYSWKSAIEQLSKTLGLAEYNIDKIGFYNVKPQCVDDNIASEYVHTYLTSKDVESRRNIDTIIDLITQL